VFRRKTLLAISKKLHVSVTQQTKVCRPMFRIECTLTLSALSLVIHVQYLKCKSNLDALPTLTTFKRLLLNVLKDNFNCFS